MTTTIKLTREWHLGSELAKGGFGTVYEAESDADNPAVVTLIPKAPGADRELLFENLQNVPNVIPILDSGEWKDNWVLVMPRAEKSLRQHLDDVGGPLPTDEALDILTDIAEALAGLETEVVHRDLKPENVLLYDVRWCLADFGISRYAEASTAPDTKKYSMTPPYAAPEQWKGERATSATDVYAFGVMTYEMIAGQRPFSGPDSPDFRKQHLEDDPAPPANCPPWLSGLIEECLFKAQEARPTAANVLARLRGGRRPASESAKSLQEASRVAAEIKSAKEAKASAAQTESERRDRLLQAATITLGRIRDLLRDRITEHAPQTEAQDWPLTLNDARISVPSLRAAKRSSLQYYDYDPPFDVIAFTEVNVRIPPDRSRYEGRSHSLWYCAAQEEGVYRWYETAFMISGMIPKQLRQDPSALDPGKEAAGALSNVSGEFQIAWPFTPIDQGEEEDFIERWMGWFGEAATGKLQHPRYMPERDPKGSWRSS